MNTFQVFGALLWMSAPVYLLATTNAPPVVSGISPSPTVGTSTTTTIRPTTSTRKTTTTSEPSTFPTFSTVPEAPTTLDPSDDVLFMPHFPGYRRQGFGYHGYIRRHDTDLLSNTKCQYGERGSLTAFCSNLTSASYFKDTMYKFDRLDETLQCLDCSLPNITEGVFELQGNEIKNLILSNSNIKNIGGSAFVGLVMMQRLDLANNQIASLPSDAFYGVRKIRVLDLRNNTLSDIGNGTFAGLTSLETLYLSNNSLGRTLKSESFDGLSNLKELLLSHNLLNFNCPRCFNALESLEYLDLSYNRFTFMFLPTFTKLKKLQILNLSHNNILSISLFKFEGMSKLYSLDLSYNQIRRIDGGSFHGLTGLRVLDLANNMITWVPIKTFQSMHELEYLDLANNSIWFVKLSSFTALSDLRSLNLKNNSIDSIDYSGNFRLHQLHTLDLSSNRLTSLSFLSLIAKIPTLAHLKIANNKLSCELENDMLDFFKDDNFVFDLFNNETNPCYSNYTNSHYLSKSELIKDLKQYEIREIGGVAIFAFVFIAIVFVILGVMFFFQYRTMKFMRLI